MKRKTTKWLGCLLATTAIAVTTATAADEAGSSRIQPDNSNHTDRSSDFYAYYTRLEYDDHSNTGQYADLIVKIGTNGRFVFCREFGYLPYWQPSGTKYFVDRLLPVTGDGPPERPDAINKCSYVRLIESSPDRIVVHWRYAPDLNSPHFTDFQRTYSGDIGSYFADYAEEYFTITADGRITREAKKGCVRLDEWNDPLNKTTQILELTASGIDVQSTTPARLQRRPGDPVPGAPVVKGGVESPALWMRFDEGLSAQDDFTRESVKGSKCRIGGADSYWRKGVSGTCLSFDGYTSRVTVPSRELPNIRGDFTIEAWIAPQEYSWDWSGVVDHGRDKRAGYRLAMDHLGRIALEACLDGRWEGLTTSNAVELLKWTFVTATYRKGKGFCDLLGRSPGGFRIRDRGGPGCAGSGPVHRHGPGEELPLGVRARDHQNVPLEHGLQRPHRRSARFRPGSGRVGDTLGLSGLPTRRFVAPELLGLARWADERQGLRGGLYETSIQSGMGRPVAGGGPCRHRRNV